MQYTLQTKWISLNLLCRMKSTVQSYIVAIDYFRKLNIILNIMFTKFITDIGLYAATTAVEVKTFKI